MNPRRADPASWMVSLHDDFEVEFAELSPDVQDGLLAAAEAIQMAGPKAGRPHVDTVILVAGAKQGKNQRLFYKTLIGIADRRFDQHLRTIKAGKKRSQ
jgi:hypothetical protein